MQQEWNYTQIEEIICLWNYYNIGNYFMDICTYALINFYQLSLFLSLIHFMWLMQYFVKIKMYCGAI